MDDFSLIVNLPEVLDEKVAKELRSSLENRFPGIDYWQLLW